MAGLGIPLAGREAGLVSTGLLSCWIPTPDLAGPNLSLREPHIPEAPPEHALPCPPAHSPVDPSRPNTHKTRLPSSS